MLDIHKIKSRRLTANGVELHYREAGSTENPTIVLLHGYPSSSFMFRNIMEPLAESTHVLAFDMPGFGLSEAPPLDEFEYTFASIARTLQQALTQKGVQSYYLYMHDWGAIVGYLMALSAPEKVRGLVVQNGAAHAEGFGPDWDAPRAFWKNPTRENRAALGEWMNEEGVRNEYYAGLDDALAALVAPECWRYDWERLSRPGAIDRIFALYCDVGSHLERFEAISAYHREHQPPCLILWGRRDVFFEIDEISAYARELDPVESHVFDGGHFLLESHHRECSALIERFVAETAGRTSASVAGPMMRT
ncbi:alpha/beta fold hydrolase [Salinarimonas sp.]|uniref:alpha/beta fold hydrolase n=1 Tax=Salinarimonas sp. TaxID=2766526 RepID=UPI00391A2E3A